MLFSRSLKLAVLGSVVMVGAVLAGGCDRQSAPDAQPRASGSAAKGNGGPGQGTLDRGHKGSVLPDFTLTDPAGKTLRLTDLKGKPALVNLWATWCAPCIAELPTLDRLAGEQGAKLRVLTVSQDMSNTEKVAPFLAEKGGARLEPWLDPHNDLAFHYATGTLPTTILYDAQGREVWRFVGEQDWTGAEAAKQIAEAF